MKVFLLIFLLFPILAFAANHDAVITTQINSALSKNELTHGQLISVETHNGVVTLKGKTDSVTEATKAIEIAASTANVKNVDSTELFVINSAQPLSDAYTTAKIKGLFLKNLVFGVSVETQNGVVYLNGTVKSSEQRSKLIKLATSVGGVVDVKSSLDIKNGEK